MKKLNLIFISFFLISQLSAQTTLESTQEGSVVTIEGTSSVHDWESKVEEFTSSITFNLGQDSISIESLSFSAIVNSIKSGKSVMDRKTRSALKAGDYPSIAFEYDDIVSQTADSITVSGNLNLAGVSLPVTVTAFYFLTEEAALNVVGTQEINMKDFGISPPTAMMGTLKTGETVHVKFDLIFEN